MAIKLAPENKAIVPAMLANKAAPAVERLALEHGLVQCSCGAVLQCCQHLGHSQLLRTVERGCQSCRQAP